MNFHDLWTAFKTDWHKIGILFLVLKELKVFFHVWNSLTKTARALSTKEGRAALWQKIRHPFTKTQ